MESKKPKNLEGDQRLERLKQKAAQAEAAALKKNIYKRGVFERLAEVGSEVLEIANFTNRQYRDVLAEAGIKDPYDVLVQSMTHWDKMLAPSKLPSEEQLVEDLRQNFQLRVVRAAEVFVPPDIDLPSRNGDSEESKEKGDDVNKVALALEALLHMKLGGEQLAIEDMDVVVGRVPEPGWRTRPYWIITLKNHKIAVFVNNQYANRTFVVGYEAHKDLEIFEGYTKEQLKELSEKNKMLHHFIYENVDQFKSDLSDAVQKVFEGKEMLKPYPTYQEASAAAKKLGIISELKYRERYKEDPRLLAIPNRKYKDRWEGWGVFLGTRNIGSTERGKVHYQTIEEARDAAKQLSITSSAQYNKRHKEDPRLPADPYRKYKDRWEDWTVFLGTESKSSIDRGQYVYQTYEEASAVAKKLQITSVHNYQERYKEDPRLPSHPNGKYKDSWKGWGVFLGTEKVSSIERGQEVYQTYEEASAAAKQLSITSSAQYNKRHKEDSRLPSNPDKKYADKGWKGWEHFLGKE